MPIEFLDPTADAPSGKSRLTPRLGSLDSKTIGVLSNGRPNVDFVLDRLTAKLEERHHVKIVRTMKPWIGNIAPKEIFDQLRSSCDAVITGVGD